MILFTLIAVSCATQKKLANLKKGIAPSVMLTLGENRSTTPELDVADYANETLTVTDDKGNQLLFMKAVLDDETGEMVATEVLKAATVTARFRNVAERHGKVNLAFQVIVPKAMMDSKWQLRFYPDMFVLEDSLRLDPVIITGSDYRKEQLRGYQQYEKFLSRIISDTSRFINIKQLEIFLKRNIPDIYAFKADTSYVTDDQFYSVYGLSQQEAVEHYTNHVAKNRNNSRIKRKDEMFRKYVKSPVITEGIRLDTVIVSPSGDFIYNYIQTISTRPKLRKADIVLSGAIFESDRKVYTIPQSSPLTFYISSVSTLADGREHYITKIIERKAVSNARCRIDFKEGGYDVIAGLNDNKTEIAKIKNILAMLSDNVEFGLDSITVSATASPEGTFLANRSLAQKRSVSVSEYFRRYINELRDSLSAAAGIISNLDDAYIHEKSWTNIHFLPRCIPENWEDLYEYVQNDTLLTLDQKREFVEICKEQDLDTREKQLQEVPFYAHLKNVIYPRLRTVKFNFYLHRKGMVKDTVHTTVPDTLYRNGVQAIRDMDYLRAVEILGPYRDYNTAVAYIGLDRNASALDILEQMERKAEVNYLLSILYSRAGNYEAAVQCYMDACRQNGTYVHRGNLDPEISALIQLYGLNAELDNIVE